jgi:hypothetical protein
MVGSLRGETTMFDVNATAGDNVVDAISIFTALIANAFIYQIIFTEAVLDLHVAHRWTRFLLGAIADGSEWTNEANYSANFHTRLDTQEQVEAYAALYRSVRLAYIIYGNFHKR